MEMAIAELDVVEVNVDELDVVELVDVELVVQVVKYANQRSFEAGGMYNEKRHVPLVRRDQKTCELDSL